MNGSIDSSAGEGGTTEGVLGSGVGVVGVDGHWAESGIPPFRKLICASDFPREGSCSISLVSGKS